ncbi:MAG: 2,3-bisphosphoglycerate-dependent phosphoglycerate mutase, partial [Alphaproteobacteria bacterium]
HLGDPEFFEDQVERVLRPPQGRGEVDVRHVTGGLQLDAGYVPDVYFTSALRRAQHTLDLILEELGITEVTITRSIKLNERDYGDLTSLNKDDARAKWGEEQVLIWRRSFDVPPPGGESLKDTAARTLPYYEREIVPLLKAGKTVLVAAHGNSLRSIVMSVEGLTPDEILKRELATGEPVVYRIGADGKLAEKVAI